VEPGGVFAYYRRFGVRVVGALGIELAGCDIPIGIRPKPEALTVDSVIRGSGSLVTRRVHIRFASPRNLTSRVPKGKIPEKTVGDRTPEWEWKSTDSSGRGVRRSWWSDPLLRVWVTSSGIRAGVGVPFVQVMGRNIFENAAQKREAIT
jgi:hypothetical protein